MRSVMECLDKAAEMDVRAAECAALDAEDARAIFVELGHRWRCLAIRALRHDAWGQLEPNTR
jgi:hypothetical protein